MGDYSPVLSSISTELALGPYTTPKEQNGVFSKFCPIIQVSYKYRKSKSCLYYILVLFSESAVL